MFKVFYDGYVFYRQRQGGINNVFREIFKRINNHSDLVCAVTFPSSNKCDDIHCIKKFIIPKIRPGRYFPYFWKIVNELYMKNFNPNIFHSTFYTEPIFDRRMKKVLTIHDMVHEIYNSGFNTKNKCFVQLKKKLAYEADAIICVSESTKQDVLKYYKIDPSRIFVIHNSCDELFKESVSDMERRAFSKKFNLFNPYILYVGRIKGYKNFDLLLDVYTSSSEISSNRDLVIITSDTYSPEQIKKISRYSSKIKQFHDLPAHELKMFYSCADLFAYPSKYEGFGIPVLEAMACGIPVIASRISSIHEVGGNAALYFNPHSHEDLLAKITKVMNDKELRKTLINRGYENIKRFSWDQSVNKLVEVYKTLLIQ